MNNDTDLMDALRNLNKAAYAAIKAGRDVEKYPYLNRQKLRQIARLTDDMVEHTMVE